MITPPPTPLKPATAQTLLERDVALILEILTELRPLADLLRAPLDETGHGMVVRLLALLKDVEEELELTRSQRLDLMNWKEEINNRLSAVEAALKRQTEILDDLRNLFLGPIE